MSKVEVKVCNCKKSNCLKLYCDCFAISSYCSPKRCNCISCHNNVAHVVQRSTAIASILERNPNAFKPKLAEEEQQHKKGCHCKKSHCLKKYCECYQINTACSEKCRCQDCKNTIDGLVAVQASNAHSRLADSDEKDKTTQFQDVSSETSSPSRLQDLGYLLDRLQFTLTEESIQHICCAMIEAAASSSKSENQSDGKKRKRLCQSEVESNEVDQTQRECTIVVESFCAALTKVVNGSSSRSLDSNREIRLNSAHDNFPVSSTSSSSSSFSSSSLNAAALPNNLDHTVGKLGERVAQLESASMLHSDIEGLDRVDRSSSAKVEGLHLETSPGWPSVDGLTVGVSHSPEPMTSECESAFSEDAASMSYTGNTAAATAETGYDSSASLITDTNFEEIESVNAVPFASLDGSETWSGGSRVGFTPQRPHLQSCSVMQGLSGSGSAQCSPAALSRVGVDPHGYGPPIQSRPERSMSISSPCEPDEGDDVSTLLSSATRPASVSCGGEQGAPEPPHPFRERGPRKGEDEEDDETLSALDVESHSGIAMSVSPLPSAMGTGEMVGEEDGEGETERDGKSGSNLGMIGREKLSAVAFYDSTLPACTGVREVSGEMAEAPDEDVGSAEVEACMAVLTAEEEALEPSSRGHAEGVGVGAGGAEAPLGFSELQQLLSGRPELCAHINDVLESDRSVQEKELIIGDLVNQLKEQQKLQKKLLDYDLQKSI